MTSESARKVQIKWDTECLWPDDPFQTVDKLLKSQWNRMVAKRGLEGVFNDLNAYYYEN